MPRRPPGSPGTPPERHWADAKAVRAERDAADLQRLIRYVERWRMAHFQTPDARDARSRGRLSADRRIGDADMLLQKLRAGLSVAAAEASGALRAGGQSSQTAFLY